MSNRSFALSKRATKRAIALSLFQKERQKERSLFQKERRKELSLFQKERKSENEPKMRDFRNRSFFAQKKERSLIFKMSECPTLPLITFRTQIS